MSLEKAFDLHKETECLPCPFCGGTEIVTYKYNHDMGVRYSIFCAGCLAEINPGWAQERSALIEMWNKRA